MDVLHDDGIKYKEALEKADCEVTLKEYDAAHAFWSFNLFFPTQFQTSVSDLAIWLNKVYNS